MILTEEEKQELERDVLLLKESMEILHEMIGEQGEMLDHVEEDTNKTTGLVILGTNQIDSAEGYTGFYVAAAGILGLIGSVLIGLMLWRLESDLWIFWENNIYQNMMDPMGIEPTTVGLITKNIIPLLYL